MSFGKLTLLSADCFGSGTMMGSSRMVADSSGTWGAPGGVAADLLAGVLGAALFGARAERRAGDGAGVVSATTGRATVGDDV